MAERWRDRGKGERGEGERCHWVRIFVNGMDGGCLGRLPRVGVESCYSLITTEDQSTYDLTTKPGTAYHEHSYD